MNKTAMVILIEGDCQYKTTIKSMWYQGLTLFEFTIYLFFLSGDTTRVQVNAKASIMTLGIDMDVVSMLI